MPPLIRFQFQRTYSGLYSNKHDRFVLREEHIAELKRLVQEHSREGNSHLKPLSMSDILNSLLDFGFEHPLAFRFPGSPEHLRDALAREVYLKAFLQFMRHEII